MNNFSTPKKLAITATLMALGFAGNYLALPVAYSVAFIFGSIFSIITIGLLGTWWGLGVAIVASSYTAILWNHPYALIIFAMEALWIAIALRRGKSNLVLIDVLFWLCVGSLLVVLFYGGIMHLNAQAVTIIILKQAINGVFNALIASLILYQTPICRIAGKEYAESSYKTLLFNVICAFLMFPALSLLLYQNYQENTSLNKQVATRIQKETKVIENELTEWLASYMNAVGAIARLGGTYGLTPSVQLQNELERINKLFPDFHNLYLGNKSGTTVAFYPPENEKGESTIGLNFADRPYFKQLVETGTPVISDVFSGRGGVFKPIFTISFPVIKDSRLSHFALGAINLDNLWEKLKNHAWKSGLVVTLLDSNRNIISSSDATRKSLEKLPEMKGSDIITSVPDVFLRVPGAKKNAGLMQVWKNAYYFSNMPVSRTSWTLQVEYILLPMQKQLYASAIKGLSAIALLFLLMIGIAVVLSRHLTGPLLSLAKISADLPSKIEKRDEIVWPKSNIAEVAMLVDNFQITSEALGSKIGNLAQRLSLAADAAKIGVWDYYIPENKLIWDKWMYALYRIREEDFLGAYQAWQNGLHPDDKVRGDVEIDQAIQGEKEFDTEFRVIWPSGEIRYIKANALVIRDLDGMALRMIGINYDITARKQAEKKLDEYRNSLEQKVRLRTKELEKVHKALVDKALEAGRSQLSAMVLHNIGNAVTPISVYARNLQNSEMKELNQYLQSCYQELLKHKHNFTEYLVQDIRGADVLELMGELITSLADGQKQALDIMGKIISGIDHISEILTLQRSYAPGKARIKESVNLTSLANDALKMQEGALEKRNIAIKSSFFHPIPALKIEKSKLMQVIVNLIKNSCDAIQESGSDRQHTIIVETWHRDAKIGFRIEDTGIGIEKDRFKEIFKFGVSSKGSSGFGLYYCKSFVETNNGKIYLESPGMGKGTTFAIEFSLPD